MQSGITASAELQSAFQSFTTDTSQFALLAHIAPGSESITPLTTLPFAGTPASFLDSLPQLEAHLPPSEPRYVFLRDPAGDGDGRLISVTYVPQTAPPRAKTLHASSRLTLLKSLGLPTASADALFVTDADELSLEGWRRHVAHEALAAPLTEEERSAEALREAEATEGWVAGTAGKAIGGTGVHHAAASSGSGAGTGVRTNVAAGAVEELRKTMTADDAAADNFVSLKIDVPTETIVLDRTARVAGPADLTAAIDAQEPRYSFWRAPGGADGAGGPVLFVYTCPTGSRPKERMLYASTRWSVVHLAEGEAGVGIYKRLEASDPSDLTPEDIEAELRPKNNDHGGEGAAAEGAQAPLPERKAAFARPKRPGRR